MRLLLLPALFGAVASAIAAPPPPASAQPAPIADLVRQVVIPWQQFTLANGLRVIVHTDRKTPVVAVSVWYHVGSKDEPAGETGFAHLFEHLMFNGSENSRGEIMKPLQQIGATDMNGSTWFDRTNYFETVPTAALPFALFLESDRMGHLLGAVDQKTLDTQRGVVQNEKRQDDNEPYGLVQYAEIEALSPAGHPYHHTTIGSMADLDRASLATVKAWFHDHYGPNNAVLVLAGDIDVAAAKPLVERYFGDIPRGPASIPAAADVPTLVARRDETIHDQVATTRLYRTWYVPGLTAPDTVPLDVGAAVLGGLSSSRLDDILVRQEKLAVGASAELQPFERLSQYEVSVDVRPGVDPALVGRRLDQIIAGFIRTGPTADEVSRAVTREVAGRIEGLESVGGGGGKATALAEGALYANDPDFSVKELAAYAAVTPESVRRATAKWLSRPAYALTVAPGPRGAYEEAEGGKGAGWRPHPAYHHAPATPPPASAAPGVGVVAPPQNPAKPARVPPPVGAIADLRFPRIERARLANGIEVVFARREGVPITRVALSFDAGNAADPKDKLGLQSLMLALLDEGTASLDSTGVARAEERLGAGIGAGTSMDRTTVSLSALTPNLAPSLDLLADIVQHPAFRPAEIERVRAQQLTGIAAEMTEPQSIALRTLPPLLYGRAHPYGVPFSGTGDPAVIAKVGRDDMLAFKAAWLRPDKARIFVVSDRPLAELVPLLDARFGAWSVAGPGGVKDVDAPVSGAPAGRVLLIDRPGVPQSLILGGQVTSRHGTDDNLALLVANDVLGGDFLSRMNMDLRESRHFSYGVASVLSQVVGPMPWLVYAPVQANRTGASIAALVADMHGFLTTQGVTEEERDRSITGRIRELPGSYETSADILGAIQRNVLLKRPDDFYDTLASRYRALDRTALDAAIRQTIDPARLLWVVVGDAGVVKPQLATLGMPIEVVKAQ